MIRYVTEGEVKTKMLRFVTQRGGGQNDCRNRRYVIFGRPNFIEFEIIVLVWGISYCFSNIV